MKQPETFHKVVTVGVDIQNDFCPGGALGVDEGDQIVAPFNAVTRWTRDNNGQVVFTRDQHPLDTKHFEKWPPHCVHDTPGGEFHPDLEVTEADIILSKGMGHEDDAYSGFEAVAADSRTLKDIITQPHPHELRNRVAVLIGGLATDYCVKQTTLDANKLANHLNYPETADALSIFVLDDAIRAVNLTPHDGDQAIELMFDQGFGATFVSTQDVLEGRVLRIEEPRP